MAVRSAPRNYDVTIEGWGNTSTYTVTAATRAAARYSVWADLEETINDVSFGDFLRKWVRSVRVSRKEPTPYDYVRERYGVHVAVGDRVFIRGGGTGTVAEPPASNPRASHVYVATTGRPQPYHPISVRRVK